MILKKILVFMLIAFTLLLPLVSCSNFSKIEAYTIGDEQIASIYAVVGERSVLGVESSTSGGVPEKTYKYSSNTVTDDLLAYFTYLNATNWVLIQDYNLNVVPGSAQYAKNSTESGKVLIITVSFDTQRYNIHITKIEGTLTIY